MATRKTRVQIDTTADTSGAKKAAAELGKVDKAAEKVNTTQTKGAIKATAGNKKLTNSLGGVSLQMQDVAVQAQMGTDAVRILGQQGPQIASVFGPTGAIAGAAIALGAILVDALVDKWIGDLERGTEHAKKLYEKLAADMAKAIGEDAARATQAFIDKLDLAAEKIEAGHQASLRALDTEKQRAQMASALEAAIRKTTEQQILYRAAIDDTVDADKELQKLRDVGQDAKDASKLAEQEHRINVLLEKRRQMLEDIAKAQFDFGEITAEIEEKQRKQSFLGSGLAQFRREALARGDDPSEAISNDPSASQALAQSESLGNEVEDLYTRGDALLQSIASMELGLGAHGQVIEEQRAAYDELAKHLEALGEQRGIQEALANAVDEQKDTVKELGEGIKQFDAGSKVQLEAVSTINTAIKDGIITAQEQQRIGESLQVLFSTLTSAQQDNQKLLLDLIAQMQRMQQSREAAKTKVKTQDATIIR